MATSRLVTDVDLDLVSGGNDNPSKINDVNDNAVYDYKSLEWLYKDLMDEGYCINCWKNLHNNFDVQMNGLSLKADRIGNTLKCGRCGMTVINIPKQ